MFFLNSFGLYQNSQLTVPVPLHPNQTSDGSVLLTGGGPVLRQNPLNLLQIALKNNVGVFYFNTNVPPHVLLSSDGKMDKKVFLATWKDIPAANEKTSVINDVNLNTGKVNLVCYLHNCIIVHYRCAD